MNEQIPNDLQAIPNDLQAVPSQEHPWKQFNAAARSGQMPELGKEYPGGGYVPTLGEAGADVAGLGATIAATPLAAAVAPGMPVLGPMIGRTLAGAVPGLLQGDTEKAGWGMAGSGSMEALASVLGMPGFVARSAQRFGAPAVHQAVQPPAGGGPIVINRMAGAQGTPTIHGGGGSSVSPTQVTVAPPASGSWSSGPNSPAVILQERLGGGHIPPTFGTFPRTVADTWGQKNPEEALTGGMVGMAGLNALRKMLPGMGGHTPIPPVAP